jgi:hypothetical protein
LWQIETIPLRENSTAEKKSWGDLLQIETIPLREYTSPLMKEEKENSK